MAGKYAAFVGTLHGFVACQCGVEMHVSDDKTTYVCVNKMCQRYQKEYTAIIMPTVLFYEKEKT